MTTPKPALPEPVPPNAEGSTTCIVRWMVTTRDGLWLGAWDKEAFAAYTQFAIDAAVAQYEQGADVEARLGDEARAEVKRLRAAVAEARAEIANLKTVMIAAAEEIAAHWEAHCDAEGYGPQNLLRRLEEGIPSEYGYTAGAFAELKAKAEARAVPALTFDAFRAANVARCVKWHPEGIASWSPSDWLTAVTGELGELASLLKMRNRERDGLPGNKFSPTQKQIADELADVLAYLDLLAEVLGVDLGRAAVEKFNEVSERVGFSDRIAIIATPSPAEQPKPAVVDLPDSIRVPLHRLWADAGYLIGRAKNGETDLAVHTIKALCDELERAIRAALQGEQP